MLVVRSPPRVYSTFVGSPSCTVLPLCGAPGPTRRKPWPSIATSSGLLVDWKAPSDISLIVACTCTPRPTCSGLVPPLVLVGPEAPRITCVSESANVTLAAL